MLNVLCIVVVVFGIHTWGAGVFDLRYVVTTDDFNFTSVPPSTTLSMDASTV